MRKFIIGTVIAVMLLSLVIGSAALPARSMQRAEANAGTQWNAQYFNNTSLSGSPALQRIDDQINFNWGNGSPDAAINADGFSVRWTKTVNFSTSGKWVFHIEADDSLNMWIDSTQIVAKWGAGGYWTEDVTIGALTAGDHDLKVEYKEETAGAQVKVWWEGPDGTTTTTTGRTCSATWSAQYFNNGDLSGDPEITRTDTKIDFNWVDGSPDAAIGGDTFSARWTTTINFTESGHWRFYAGADDGINIWVDVTQILDEWHTTPDGYRNYEANVYELTAGNHNVKVEYFEETGNAGVQVCWEFIATTPIGTGGGGTGAGDTAVIMPTAVPPAVVYAAVVGDKVNVRTGPGRGNPVMAKIPYNEDYLVLAGVPDLSWLLIQLHDGREGWVSNEWVWLYATDPEKNKDTTEGGQPDFVDDIPRIDLEVAPPAYPAEDDPLRKILTGSATDTLNLRDGGNIGGSRIIGTVPQNATFTVEAHNGNGAWYLINYQGIRGWVSALYVRLLDGYVSDLVVSSEVVPAPPIGQVYVPEDNQGNPAVTVRGRAISNLKLRDEPSILSGDQLGSVPQYSEFVIDGRTANGSWYLITWDGQTGWVNAAYVSLLEGTVSDIPIR
ncbi:MAG: SH3 domain-containing protein [Anaerolineae bacterium]|nr:SH3 domain-containing protein [Anaerolineae bacterium]